MEIASCSRLQDYSSQNEHHSELQFKQNLMCNVYVNIGTAERNCSEISQMQRSGHKMSVILWNCIFKTIIGYFYSWVKFSLVWHNFIFTYSWKTFGFELLHSLEHILLDAPSWAGGSTWGWYHGTISARSVPPLVHLDPLHPGLNAPAITRAEHQCLPWALHSCGHKTFVRLHRSKGTCYNSRKIFWFLYYE